MSAVGAPDYLQELERELADLAPDERADLLEEVEASLLELEDDPVTVLGPPARFAAELRESAGLPPAPDDVPEPPRDARPLRERLATSPTLTSLARTTRDLAPIWWAVRAYVFTLVLAAAFAAPVTKVGGIPRFGSAEAGALILAAALAGSIALGLASRRRPLPLRQLRIALDIALAVCALGLLLYEVDRRVLTGYSYDPAPAEAAAPQGLALDGVQINNLFVYDADGRLLSDVRLYDDYARPLDIRPGDPDDTRKVLTDATGATLFNTFPIRFTDPATNRVTNPYATPPGLKPARLTSRSSSSP